MTQFARRILKTLNLRWLIRAYIIGLVFFCFITWTQVRPAAPDPINSWMIGLAALNTLLFPFAKLVWEQVRDFVLGDTILIAGAISLFAAKIIINAILWTFAVLIAPIGFGLCCIWLYRHD